MSMRLLLSIRTGTQAAMTSTKVVKRRRHNRGNYICHTICESVNVAGAVYMCLLHPLTPV
uniref:Uncharacterized protein n=1 Tax=Octopus bimaculoides TaxID=37653 RepID=A0A0L8FUJ8_OCTBM